LTGSIQRLPRFGSSRSRTYLPSRVNSTRSI
jgi:hypothetical protein